MKILFLFLAAITSAAILGIDLGQQFTKAVLLAPGILFELVLTDEGKRKELSGLSIRSHPSAIDELERVYGSATGSLCTRFPKSCALHLKSLLGKSSTESSTIEYIKLHFINVFGDESRNDAVHIDVGIKDQLFSVEELIGMSLNDIRQRAIADLEELSHSKSSALLDVAISISPFANQNVRQSYLDSLALANFTSVLGLIDDGVAVALNFASNKKEDDSKIVGKKEYNLIYDMGAGSTKTTLFSTLLHKNGSVDLEIESIGYDESLGGQLLTNSIANVIKTKFLEKFNIKKEKSVSDKVWARIYDVAEKAKIVLSVNTDYFVALESLWNDKDFKTTISKEEFEDINADLIKRVTNPITQALEGTGVSIIDLKNVVLTGGSTRVPFIQKGLLSILSEDQISKNVNADESCAVGTTARAFKLKTLFEKAKDIKVIDKVFHDFGISVDGEPLSVLFEKGSQISNTTTVNFTKSADKSTLEDEIEIVLYEDDSQIKTYKIDGIVKKGEKLKCKSKKETKQLVGKFAVDNNKIFDLINVEIQCVKPEVKESSGFIKNFLKKSVEEDEEEDVQEEDIEDEAEAEVEIEDETQGNSTNSTTKEKKKSKIIKRSSIPPRPVNIIIPKPTYSNVKPMSNVTKDRIFKKLSLWNSLDESRYAVDAIKNILEGQCYEFRNFLSDNEEVLEQEIEDRLNEYSEFVSEVIEWLEFESEGSAIDKFHEQIKNINDKHKELENIIQMTKTDLSVDGLSKLYEEGSQLIMSIQGYLIEFGTEISELREKFAEHEFDFDKENDKLKLQALNKNGGADKMLSLDKTLEGYKESLTKLGDLIDLNPNKFAKVSKHSVWKIYNEISNKVLEMISDVALVEKSHRERIETFELKLKKLKERKLQKEFRERLRGEAKKKQEEKEAAAEDAKDESEEPEVEEIVQEVPKSKPESKTKTLVDDESIDDEL